MAGAIGRYSIMALAALKDDDAQFSTGESFADLFEGDGSRSVSEGSVIKGTVVGIEKDLAIIDVGLKSEGRIALREFGSQASEIRVGDVFDVYIERMENREGEAVLSREKALREEGWMKLEQIFKGDGRVEGTIFGRVK